MNSEDYFLPSRALQYGIAQNIFSENQMHWNLELPFPLSCRTSSSIPSFCRSKLTGPQEAPEDIAATYANERRNNTGETQRLPMT